MQSKRQGEHHSILAHFNAGMDMHELLALNHELDPDSLGANPHILVPRGRVSDTDRLVLHNMKTRRYRTYAAKQNESIDDIISARNITREEVKGLNPDVDLGNLADHEIIKLPAHKYSPHEQHEMQGTLGGPEALTPGSWLANTLTAGVAPVAKPSRGQRPLCASEACRLGWLQFFCLWSGRSSTVSGAQTTLPRTGLLVSGCEGGR